MLGQRKLLLVLSVLAIGLTGLVWVATAPAESRIGQPAGAQPPLPDGPTPGAPADAALAAAPEPVTNVSANTGAHLPDDPIGAYVRVHQREPAGRMPVPCGTTSGVRHLGVVMPPERALEELPLERTRFFSRGAASACLHAFAKRGPIVLLGDSTSVENFYDLTWLLSANGGTSLDDALRLATRMPLEHCKGRLHSCCPLHASGVSYNFCSSHHNVTARVGELELRSEYITPGVLAYTVNKRRGVLRQLGMLPSSLRLAAPGGPLSANAGQRVGARIAAELEQLPAGRRPALLVVNSGHHDMAGCYKGGTQKAWQFKCDEAEVLDRHRLGVRRLVTELLVPCARLGTMVVWRSNNPTIPFDGHRSLMLLKLDAIAFEETAPLRALGGAFVNVSMVLMPFLRTSSMDMPHLGKEKKPYTDDGGTHIGTIAHFYRNKTHSLEASMLVTQLLLNATCDARLSRCGGPALETRAAAASVASSASITTDYGG